MTKSDSVRRKWIGFLGPIALVLAVFGGLYWHKHAIGGLVQTALKGEEAAKIEVYRRGLVGGDAIVFNIASVSGETSMADIMRMMLKSAEALKDEKFGRVYLASRGKEKFYLEGDYFKQIGEERLTQNAIYTVRTMPENVYDLDGTKAFGEWTGGWLGVMSKQMEDVAELHQKWWVEEELQTTTGK